MANKYKGEYEATLGGAKFLLRFDMNALAELEDLLDDSIFNAIGRPGIKFLRAALYAGMLHDKQLARGMSLQKAGKLLNDMTSQDEMSDLMQGVITAVAKAVGADVQAIEAAMAEATGEDSNSEDPTPTGESA